MQHNKRETTIYIFLFLVPFESQFGHFFRRFPVIALEKMVPAAIVDFQFRPLGDRFVAGSMFAYFCGQMYMWHMHMWQLSMWHMLHVHVVHGHLS